MKNHKFNTHNDRIKNPKTIILYIFYVARKKYSVDTIFRIRRDGRFCGICGGRNWRRNSIKTTQSID